MSTIHLPPAVGSLLGSTAPWASGLFWWSPLVWAWTELTGLLCYYISGGFTPWAILHPGSLLQSHCICSHLVAPRMPSAFAHSLCFCSLLLHLKKVVQAPIATAFLIASHFTFPFKRFSCSDYLHSQMVTIRPVWKPHTKPFLPSHAILTSANLLFISFPWCLLLSRFSFKDHVALCHLILPIFSQSRSWLKIPLL